MSIEDLSPRQSEILALARQVGRVSVDDLAERFEVTPQTVRKDLNDLCGWRMLQRVHGGAVLSSGVENLGYEARQILAQDEKQRIGLKAAELIPDDCSLFINIGTTTEQVARALFGHRDLMVITNNINVAYMLRPAPSIDVIVAGGQVRQADGGIVGEETADFVKKFKVDYAVIGVSAIDEEGALLDFDYREVRVAQAIIANARNVILVADSMKLERSAPVRIGHLSQIDTFVTDHAPSEQLIDLCQNAGVELVATL